MFYIGMDCFECEKKSNWVRNKKRCAFCRHYPDDIQKYSLNYEMIMFEIGALDFKECDKLLMIEHTGDINVPATNCSFFEWDSTLLKSSIEQFYLD